MFNYFAQCLDIFKILIESTAPSLLVQFWQRQSAVNSYNWNTHSHSAVELERPEFHGVLSPDPVTRKPRLYYPSWKRRLWYVFSFTAMLPLLFVGVCVMALSLNLNGYIKDKNSPIYVASLSKYAAPVIMFTVFELLTLCMLF